MTPSIRLSEPAAPALREDLAGRVLRIAFTTGCGGSGYRLTPEDAPRTGDTILDVDGVTIALDDMASSNLDGAVLVLDEEEGGYLLDHPTAATTVWCG